MTFNFFYVLLYKVKIMKKTLQVSIKNLSEFEIKVENVKKLIDEIRSYKYEFETTPLEDNDVG